MANTADVAVIGGGINGCATAHALAWRGAGPFEPVPGLDRKVLC